MVPAFGSKSSKISNSRNCNNSNIMKSRNNNT